VIIELTLGAVLYSGLAIAEYMQMHKHRVGWLVFAVDTVGWAVYAVLLQQWTWLPFEVLFLIISWHGWKRWKE
jgi:hypothetical protein